MNQLAVLELAAPVVPSLGDRWPEYKQRVEEKLRPGRERAAHLFGLALNPLYAANATCGRLTAEHLREIRSGALGPSLRLLEWNLEVEAGQIANVARQRRLSPHRSRKPLSSSYSSTLAACLFLASSAS